MPATGIVIGNMSPGSLRRECCESLIGCVTVKAVDWVIMKECGPYLDDGRNQIVEAFLQPQFADCDRLLFVDSDISFSPDDVASLRAVDEHVVSGIYYSLHGSTLRPVVYDWTDTADGKRLAPIEEFSTAERVAQVTAFGFGFVMVTRDLLQEMTDIYAYPLPWFAEEVRDGVHYGEDLTWCMRVTDMGVPLHVHRDVVVAHHKTVMIAPPA